MHNKLSTDRDYNLWVLIRQTRDAMIKAREKELAQSGLSSIQAAVLFTLQAIGNEATPAEISRRLVREPHSVSGLLNRMEKQGLIKKLKDLPRKNMVRVTMTEKGQKAYYQSTERTIMHSILSILTEDERKDTWVLLEKLRDKSLKMAGIGYDLPFPAAWSDSEHNLVQE
ncbi:MAG: MarR family winged helix-turn-helix transcriptional regulator [Dehalococcoidales bacterium]|nr:MarR family winged helix-turn-helix transcriptional regulator [Dehalococcoidales bacterium]